MFHVTFDWGPGRARWRECLALVADIQAALPAARITVEPVESKPSMLTVWAGSEIVDEIPFEVFFLDHDDPARQRATQRLIAAMAARLAQVVS